MPCTPALPGNRNTGSGLAEMGARIDPFGTLPSGEAVARITLAGGGLTAGLLTYGATLQDLRLDGVDHPLVLGADHLAAYLGPLIYAGALVGRFSNRIAGGQFTLDGRTFHTDRNEAGRQTLHGGRDGASQRVWTIDAADEARAVLSLTLADGHMGFPGNLRVVAEFALTEAPALEISITAHTDAPCPVSFAHHGYFNLDGGADISGHHLGVAADHYLPTDAAILPTGEVRDVTGTAFDFHNARPLGGQKLDHNFCLSRQRQPARGVATLHGPDSGLTLRVTSSEPGLQVYTGDHFPTAGPRGLDGRRYGARAGIALETQAWPDAPNRPQFPNAILRPGETHHHRVVYGFDQSPPQAEHIA